MPKKKNLKTKIEQLEEMLEFRNNELLKLTRENARLEAENFKLNQLLKQTAVLN